MSKNQGVCVATGCNNPVAVQKRMLCRSHATALYHSWDRGECKESGCTRNVYAKGRCRPHYVRDLKGLSMDMNKERTYDKKCAVESCERVRTNFETDMCTTHYVQVKRYGKDPRPIQKRPGIQEGEKTCTRCDVTKSLGEFYKKWDKVRERFFYSGKCKGCYITTQTERKRIRDEHS